jgi:hypothetical protein
MSSINSADRNNQDEKLRRARESYQQNEVENTKKQKSEIRKLTENHQAEIQALQDAHTKQIEDFKAKATDSFTRRDMSYQKDMDEMREMHREQLRRLAFEADTKNNRTEETYKGELERTQHRGQIQAEQLRGSFEGQVRERDQKLEEFTERNRAAMKDALEQN